MAWLLMLCLAGADAEALVGQLRAVKGPPGQVEVLLKGAAKETPLVGDLCAELVHLQSARVEVLGRFNEARFRVEGYRILDVGGGGRPMVGTLVRLGNGVGLRDGDAGSILPLSAAPRSKARLLDNVNNKVWLLGKKLVSGELQVLRYGVLRGAAGDKDNG